MLNPVSQNHPLLTAHRLRRPVLPGGLGHWQWYDCDTFGQSLTTLPGNADEAVALAGMETPSTGCWQCTFSTSAEHIHQPWHTLQSQTQHTRALHAQWTQLGLFITTSKNNITHWMDGLKEMQANIAFYRTNHSYWNQAISGGSSDKTLWSQMFLSMRSVPESMPQCLLQGQQQQSRDGSKQNSTMSAKYNPHVSSQHSFKRSRNLTLKTSIFDSLKL